MLHSAIIGTGSYVPKKEVTNYDLAKVMDTSNEWIYSRTGIKARRISDGETTAELGFKAAKKALDMAGVVSSELDLIICATISPDSFMPSTACRIQNLLEAKNAVAFDISAACTGLIFGMITASQFIENGVFRKALVIGSETLSRTVDWKDRSTCVLFGDGASAVVLSASKDGGLLSYAMKSDGTKQEALHLPALPLRNLLTQREAEPSVVTMDGQEVFKFAVKSIKELVSLLLMNTGLEVSDIRYIVPHQANLRIIEQAAKLCNIEQGLFIVNLENYGNTSAASIGIALDELARNGKLNKGDKLILVGFGGGLTSGGILLEWSL